MPKKYILYTDGAKLLFNEITEKENIKQTNREYKKIINRFIDNGYTVTDSDKVIILRSKKKIHRESTTILILKDDKLYECKEFKTLKNDIERIKKTKGYTYLKVNESGKEVRIKKPHKKVSKITTIKGLFKENAVSFTIALTIIIVFAIYYGIYSSKKTFRDADSELSAKNTYSVSMNSFSEKDDLWTLFNTRLTLPIFNSNFLNDEELLENQLAINDEKKQEQKNISDTEKMYNEYLKTYAEYFHLDTQKVIDFAKDVTENYTLPFPDVIGTNAYDITSPEADSLVFAHELSKDNLKMPLASYGLTADYFVTNPNITTLSPDKVLENGQTFEQFFGHVCDLLQVDKNWLLGITYLETGRLTSSMALYKNNFGGLRGNGGFYTYISPEAGIIAHCRNLKRYETFGLQSMYELAAKYVYGNTNLLVQINADPEGMANYKTSLDIWVSSVTSFHNSFVANSEAVFGTN